MKHPAVNELIQDPAAPFQALRASIKSELHCALPGIVHSFDPETQTATIQPAIRSRVTAETGLENVRLPLLANVPVFFPGGGEYALTMPVQPGDECLVVFADNCIDAWWQSGGVQNQIDLRSHDVSDGFAFVGFRSRPNALSGVPNNTPALIGNSDALRGPAGKSNFTLWLEDGNTGTLADYFESLRGPAGRDGQDGGLGPQGIPGVPGSDATVTKANVEAVLTGTITTHGHGADKITAGTFPDGLFIFKPPAGASGAANSINTLQIKQDTSGADAFMTFHVSGDFAAHFGLDGSTNDLFFGGWSAGAVKNKVWHAGNMNPVSKAGDTMTGNLQAPRGIFTSETDVDVASANMVALITGNPTGAHIEYDGNEIMAKVGANTASTLYINSQGGPIQMGNGGLTVGGGGVTAGAGNMQTNDGYLYSSKSGKYIQIGSQNSGYCHYATDATYGHWFNSDVRCQGEMYAGPNYNQRVFHTGNTMFGSALPSPSFIGQVFFKTA